MFVASRSTGQAIPWFSASSHVLAHTHQESPGFSPGKLNWGIGVIKLLPCILANSRNSSVTIQQTVWEPLSISSVLQRPSLFQPVIGLHEHSPISWPRTFFCIPTLHREKCHTSNCVLIFLIHHLNHFGDFDGSTSSVWIRYEHWVNETRLQPILVEPRETWGQASEESFFVHISQSWTLILHLEHIVLRIDTGCMKSLSTLSAPEIEVCLVMLLVV